MKPGGGKSKGSNYERVVCKQLSLWISDGTNENLLWRSAASGGRATIAGKKGSINKEQAGDISSIAPEGHRLTDKFILECKFYADLGITNFLLGRPSKLTTFWLTLLDQAKAIDKVPLLIAKQNRYDPLLISTGKMWLHTINSLDLDTVIVSTSCGHDNPNSHITMFFADFLKCCKLLH